MTKLRVAMITPPWLALPIRGYGGIERVVQSLVEELRKLDVDVEIFGNGERKLKGVKTHSIYKTDQISEIHRPCYESTPILGAHVQFSLNKIIEDGNFDIIHDHTEYLGPQVLAWASLRADMPPVLHTKHGPPFSTRQMNDLGIPDNIPYWQQLGRNIGRLYIVGISDALMAAAPVELRPHILPTVYNALTVAQFPFVKEKKNYFYTLARFNRDKAQHVAAKLCAKMGYRLRMAGTVAGISTGRKLLFELANPLSPYRNRADFRYYSDRILPYVIRYPKITYSGDLEGAKKMKLMSEAKALLFPIDWEEPFGMVVIEAMACGTPVVAMNRGAMSEIIEHGVTGFLANDEKEFAEYMQRVDEINPAACREAVERKFGARKMAEEYLARYKQVIALDRKRPKRRRAPLQSLRTQSAGEHLPSQQ